MSSVTKWLSSMKNRSAEPTTGVPGTNPSDVEPDLCAYGATPNESLEAIFDSVSNYLNSADLNVSARRLSDSVRPIVYQTPPPLEVIGNYSKTTDAAHQRGNLLLWPKENERIISQNSSNRRVYRILWDSASQPTSQPISFPSSTVASAPTIDDSGVVDKGTLLSAGGGGGCGPTSTSPDQLPEHYVPIAMKFVEDQNGRDGRSLKREIECHIYLSQKLPNLMSIETSIRASQRHLSFHKMREFSSPTRLEDAWPCADLLGYFLDRRTPGRSVLLTRKLIGPDMFDVIRSEHNHNWHYHMGSSSSKCKAHYNNKGTYNGADCGYYHPHYEFHKLRWCSVAILRLHQYGALGVRHNDVKPDNIVLDFFTTPSGNRSIDIKLIDLGTASLADATDFTGGTSWYESPEQKLLEYFMKRRKDTESARKVTVGLSSDTWGVGLSLAEVLLGRRVVDVLKHPHGPGALEYSGATASAGPGRADYIGDGGKLVNYPYWAMDPHEWISHARSALGLESTHNSGICKRAAGWLFENMVRPDPDERVNLLTAMEKLELFAEEAYLKIKTP